MIDQRTPPSMQTVFSILFIALFVLLFSSQIKSVAYNCHNSSDLGIYGQALVELATSGSLNPYLSIRGTNIFSDHFEPIHVVMSWILKLLPAPMNSHFSVWIAIEFAWLLLFFFIIRRQQEKFFPAFAHQRTLILIGMTLLSRGIIYAFTFPIHPATWSIVPWSLLVAGLYQWSTTTINVFKFTAILIFLCLFREEFPFALLSLAPVMFIVSRYQRRPWHHALATVVIGISFTYFNFVLRLKIFGSFQNYGGIMLKALLADPLSTTWIALNRFDINYWKIFAPYLFLLLPLPFLSHKPITRRNSFFLLIAASLLPALVIRFYFNKFA